MDNWENDSRKTKLVEYLKKIIGIDASYIKEMYVIHAPSGIRVFVHLKKPVHGFVRFIVRLLPEAKSINAVPDFTTCIVNAPAEIV